MGKSAPGRSKTVPRSSWFGPFFVLSFGIAFFVVLGSFWGRCWALRGSFWCFFSISTHRFNPSTHHFIDLTHQLINLSTHQPMALRHFLTRPGGLRAARLNKVGLIRLYITLYIWRSYKPPFISRDNHLRSIFNSREFNSRELVQLFQLYSKWLPSFLTIFGHKIAQFVL